MAVEKPTPFADLLTGAVWFVVAAAIAIGAWQMDRLEHLKISIYTVPGLVPGALGLCIALMAILLMVRALRAGALAHIDLPQVRIADDWRLIVALILCLVFAIGLVGHGLPLWLAATIFVALFVFIYQYEERKAAGTLTRGAILALVAGLVSGLAIHHLFQDLFLVRLP
ncbi:MAG: tripartite tricarboxylate transporter TctB family protein [Betaproteobacteria bacterium]|nr:tripartite tricarboxylate transporter TctB family protein [Betaproteobacteria bacterium]